MREHRRIGLHSRRPLCYNSRLTNLSVWTVMFRHCARNKTCSVVALLVACLLLAMAPFAAALEIHHELAAADHDGHEHSDTDLCQWVQYHTGHSLIGDAPVPCAFMAHAPPQVVRAPILVSQSLPASRASRAPPLT
ncbi:hypothetical protein NSPZN2_80044 [Nitrospira defluvii]|uniref:DUF2946 domain-containing protein n=2 Tax=Nitrospira defluvii TaxID=330214 RepID=A0ABN7MGS5_9BACT|nr:hypothetical protein NSPZN2_80044 [Nitrospira defluvii]